MAVFRQAWGRDLQVGRGVLVDCTQQFEAALGAFGVALQAIGAVAAEAVGGVDDQRLALARQGFKRGRLQLFLVVADLQHPLLLVAVQRFGAFQQLALAGRAVVDLLDQAGVLHGLDRVGGDRGQRELLGQAQAGAGHLQQLQQAVGAVFVEEEVVELDLLEFPHVLDHALGLDLGQVQAVFPQVAVFQAAVFGEFFLVRAPGRTGRGSRPSGLSRRRGCCCPSLRCTRRS